MFAFKSTVALIAMSCFLIFGGQIYKCLVGNFYFSFKTMYIFGHLKKFNIIKKNYVADITAFPQREDVPIHRVIDSVCDE